MEVRKEPQHMLHLGDGGSKEPRKRRPERRVAHPGREGHRTPRSSARLAATRHKGRMRDRQVVMLTAYSLRGVSLGLPWGAELRVLEWGTRGRKRGKGRGKVIRELALR